MTTVSVGGKELGEEPKEGTGKGREKVERKWEGIQREEVQGEASPPR